MKEKFTKGEWRVVNQGQHNNNPSIDNIQICYSEQEECICDTVYNINDAHLIAAAPEMYEELKNLLDVSMHWQDYERIEKILAKARGES